MIFLNDLAAFLEQQLDEFLAARPGLKLQVLLFEIEQQESETAHLLQSLENQRQRAEQDILGLVDELRKWTDRIKKAEAAHRPDLVQAAQQKEQELRQRGNLLWQQMTQAKQQIPATAALLEKIKLRRQEIQSQLQKTQASTTTSASSPPPNPNPFRAAVDPLEDSFRQLELQAALEELKRSMSR